MTTTEQIARKFSDIIKSWLTPSELDEVILRNKEPKYAECCATHDFCEANMAMFDAMHAVLGVELEMENQDQEKLFHEAWTAAKAANFYSEVIVQNQTTT